MAFLTTAFTGWHTVAVPRGGTVRKAKIAGAQFDTVFATTDTTPLSASFPAQWSEKVLMWATYDDGLQAGSVAFATSDVMAITLRRREKGTGEWVEIYRKSIRPDVIEDFNFVIYDVSAKAGITYEYAFVPILSGSEGAMTIQEVTSEFKGLWICGAGAQYSTDMNVKVRTDRNFSGNAVPTIGRKFPYFVSYGQSNYDTGVITGAFAPFDAEQCKYIFDGSTQWRERLIDFLSDRKPKVIKTWDGRLWIASISPVISTEGGRLPTMTINFTQIADSNDMATLNAYGFMKEE